jgi:hypothetical protein
MGPRRFHTVVVLPNVAEFNENFGDVRLAFNAVASVDALAAQLHAWCRVNAPVEVAGLEDDTHYKEGLAQRSAGFALVRDVANAQKHVELTRGKRIREVSSAEQVRTQQVGGSFKGWKPGVWKPGAWGDRPQVVVLTNGCNTRAVRDFVAEALSFIDREMTRLNVP